MWLVGTNREHGARAAITAAVCAPLLGHRARNACCLVRGQSLVVWAIREGRMAAEGVDRHLMGGETVLTT